MVEVSDLLVRYNKFIAVDRISFQIEPGEIFGLLGPNGAGKTSSLEYMEGIRQRSGGFIKILGVDPRTDFVKLKNLIGVQLQSSGNERLSFKPCPSGSRGRTKGSGYYHSAGHP